MRKNSLEKPTQMVQWLRHNFFFHGCEFNFHFSGVGDLPAQKVNNEWAHLKKSKPSGKLDSKVNKLNELAKNLRTELTWI